MLFDQHYQYETSHLPSSHNLPNTVQLKETIAEFKKTLCVTLMEARDIERNTREQRLSPLWFAVRRHRITASMFGSVLSRKADTPPDSLVLRIIQPKHFSTPATTYGIEKEDVAIKEYISYQRSHGHTDLMVSSSGVIINPDYYYLGASPDGSVYDPTSKEQPFGYLEVKCPYATRNLTPVEACSKSGFFCEVDATGQLKLKQSSPYYSQVQGQMAIGERPWCDFVVFTLKGISVQRIPFDKDFWNIRLLPKLLSFYDNCIVPELVSPVHSLGLPIRDMSKL